MSQPFSYGGVARETIYVALGTQLASMLGLTKLYRKRVNIESLDAGQSPVGMLMQATSRAIRTKEMGPTRYHDTCLFICAVAQRSVDPNFVAATALNNLRDALDQALQRDQPDAFWYTLGGLVDFVRPVQDSYGESIQGGVWTHFATSLEFKYTPINFL